MNLFSKAVAITPSDSTDLPGGETSAIWVGGAGNVVVEMLNEGTGVTGQARNTVTFAAVAGSLLPIKAIRVKTSTASAMVALY